MLATDNGINTAHTACYPYLPGTWEAEYIHRSHQQRAEPSPRLHNPTMAISHLQNQAKSRNIPTHVPNNQLSNESIPTRRHVTFIDKEGQNHTFEVADGDNLLDIAQGSSLQSPKLRSHKARLHLQKELATFQLPFHPPKPLLRFHPYHFTTSPLTHLSS